MKKLFTIFVLLINSSLLFSGCDIFEAKHGGDSCDVQKSTIIEKSLQAYYPFDIDARDYSGNCRHAQLGGNPELVAGAVGMAYEFDGENDFIVIPDSLSPIPASRSTFVYWLKVEEEVIVDEIDQGENLFDGIILKWTHASLEKTHSFRAAIVGNSSFGRCPGLTGAGGSQTYFGRDGTLHRGWQFITIRSEEGKNLRSCYREPLDEVPLSCGGDLTSVTEIGLIIGRQELILASGSTTNVPSPSRLRGKIDEFRIYNRILSTAEELEIFNAEKDVLGL